MTAEQADLVTAVIQFAILIASCVAGYWMGYKDGSRKDLPKSSGDISMEDIAAAMDEDTEERTRR